MKGVTHLGAGALCGIALSAYASLMPETAVVTTVCAMIGSVAPDLDSETSIVGRVFFPVSWLASQIFGHRTFFHALLPWASIMGILWLIFPQYPYYLAAASAGLASHLALDLLNHTGVPLFWPIKAKISLGLCRSGGAIDKLLGRIFPALTGVMLAAYAVRLWS